MSDLGELLRQARVYKGASLRDAERATRISRTYLEALESQDFSLLPPPAYARGIVKNYSLYLGLDPAAILSLYDTSDNESVGETIQVVPATRPLEVPTHWAPNFAIIGFMLVVAAIVFAWMYSAYFQPENPDPSLASGFPTVTPIGESLLGSVILTPTATPESMDQAGGQESAPTATATEQAAETPTAPPPPPTPTDEPVEIAVAEESTEVPSSEVVDTVENEGGFYEITLVATAEVWLEVWLDWAIDSDFEGTLSAGDSVVFIADIATISSGNAGYVQVYVDGEAWGVLSDTWDETVTLP